MNTYEVERIDRQGNPIGKRKVTAENVGYDHENGGCLVFWIRDNEKGENISVAVFAPGTWGMVTLIDSAEAERLKADSARIALEAVEWEKRRQAETVIGNTITHPVASAEEIAEALKGATITTTAHDDQWQAITGTAVHDPNYYGISRCYTRAEVEQMMRDKLTN